MWMETAQLAPKTREQYKYLLRRINAGISHIPLEKLRADHVQAFIKNLREDGIKNSGNLATSTSIDRFRREADFTQRRLADISGVSIATIAAAIKGKGITVATSKRLCAVLDKPFDTVFTINGNSGKRSDRTIKHHHTVIRAILTSAKKARIIQHNVASEFMEAPKLPRIEARYLSDDEAQLFLKALLNEPDIRIKTALILDLFTGLRRGELCGLSWQDIDFNDGIIHVRRASQYVSGHGIIEVSTKNRTSDRDINVTPFVVSILKKYKA